MTHSLDKITIKSEDNELNGFKLAISVKAKK